MPKWTLPVAISIGAALTWVGLERSNVDESNQPQPEKTISTEPLEVSAPAPEQQIPLERADIAAAKESRAGSLIEGPATEKMPNSTPYPGAASDEIRDREWDARRDRSLDQLTVLSPAWVSKYFEYCTGPDRQVPMDCTNVRNLAVSLAEEGDRATDEWEKRAEIDLSQFVVSGIEQQWIDEASTVCNDKGCLMYVTIIVGAGANDFDSFVQSLLGQSWAREFRVVTDARTRSARPFSIYPPPLRTAISRRHASYLFIFLKPDTSLSEAGDRST